MRISLTVDNDTSNGRPCTCRVLLNAIENYELYLCRLIDEGVSKRRADLNALYSLKTDFMEGLVSSIEQETIDAGEGRAA